MVDKVNSYKVEHKRVQEDNGAKEFKVYARQETRKSKLMGRKMKTEDS